MRRNKKALVLNCTRAFQKVLRLSSTGNRISRRDALAVFIVEQVALNRHVFRFSKTVSVAADFPKLKHPLRRCQPRKLKLTAKDAKVCEIKTNFDPQFALAKSRRSQVISSTFRVFSHISRALYLTAQDCSAVDIQDLAGDMPRPVGQKEADR